MEQRMLRHVRHRWGGDVFFDAFLFQSEDVWNMPWLDLRRLFLTSLPSDVTPSSPGSPNPPWLRVRSVFPLYRSRATVNVSCRAMSLWAPTPSPVLRTFPRITGGFSGDEPRA